MLVGVFRRPTHLFLQYFYERERALCSHSMVSCYGYYMLTSYDIMDYSYTSKLIIVKPTLIEVVSNYKLTHNGN